jgi:DNA-binding LacI/PurR family transcriptional regulator
MVASIVWPLLTTVRQPIKKMAASAVEMLIAQCRNQINDGDDEKIRELPIEVIMRGSTTSKQ